jgi:hypothetical protein
VPFSLASGSPNLKDERVAEVLPLAILLVLMVAGLFKPEFVAGMFLRTPGSKVQSAANRRALAEPYMWSTRELPSPSGS